MKGYIIFLEELFLQEDCTSAITDKLEPRAEKKSPNVPISLGLKFLAIIQESVLAKVTSSHPEGQLQEFMSITYLILLRKVKFMIN